MTDLVPYAQPSAWVALVEPAAHFANQIAKTEFVPQEMRNKPDVVAACIMYGAELGLGPMQSLAKIDIVKGRPAPRAELARALALAAGHELWVDEASSNTKVTVHGRRRGSSNVMTVAWTQDDVKRAGISSAMYQKYPRQMLLARASAELVRMVCPDVLGGIALFAEEVEAGEVDGTAEPVQATATQKRSRAKAAIEPPPAPALPDEVPPALDAPHDGPSDAQIRKLMASFGDVGIREKGDRLAFTVAVIGRELTTSKDMTPDEVSAVIDSLSRVVDGSLSLAWENGRVLLAPNDDLPPLPLEVDG